MTDQLLTARESLPPRASGADWTSKGRAILHALTTTGATASSLPLRLALAVAIFPHGAQKLLGWFGGPGFAGTLSGFEQGFGIPAPLAVLAVVTEFFAPVALVLGGFTRVAAAALTVQMLVAMRFHLGNGFFMNWYGNQAGEGFEYHLLAIGIALGLVVLGAGRWSLDRRIAAASGE